ncbi:NUDIX domain-containing protein [Streptomyces sp. NPDC001663]|uniref:NUDIX domain-containing protein n=1 Tax=Streptomyces sp. NPDC001663 TaxID=3364597 RepID=UPI00368BAE61
MSGQPAQSTIDTHVLLRAGGKILLSQRGGSYGYRRWHLPSGKLDQGEHLTVGAARELFEETDVRADPDPWSSCTSCTTAPRTSWTSLRRFWPWTGPHGKVWL